VVFSSGGGLRLRPRSWRVNARGSPLRVTVLFVSVSAGQNQLSTDWAEDCDEIILRRCPVCERDSIVGHGRRRKQAHDKHHDWIWIHRGRCADCGTTFTFLPVFSLPYTHYSLVARSQALRLRFAEHCSWKRLCRTSRILTACRTRRQCGAGRAAWTALSSRFPFSARPSRAWLIGCLAVVRFLTRRGRCPG